jgi:hypothetical protein
MHQAVAMQRNNSGYSSFMQYKTGFLHLAKRPGTEKRMKSKRLN